MLLKFKPLRGLSRDGFPDLSLTLNYSVVLFLIRSGFWLFFPAEWFWTEFIVLSAFPMTMKCSSKVTWKVGLDLATCSSCFTNFVALWNPSVFPGVDAQHLSLGRRAKGLSQIHALIVRLGSKVALGTTYHGKATRLKLWSHFGAFGNHSVKCHIF